MNSFKIKQEWIWELSIILVNIFVFFGYLIPQRSAFLLITSGFFFLIYVLFNKKIYRIVINQNAIWLFVLFFLCIQLLYTVGFDLSLKFIMTFGATLLMKIVYESLEYDLLNFDWKNKFLKYSLIFSGIHVVSSLLYNFYPDLIINLNKSLLKSLALSTNLLQHSQGLNPGITNDYGINAFYNLMFCGLMITKVLTSKKMKIFDIILLIASIISLIIIGKSNILLCFFIGVVICFLLAFNKMSLKKRIMIIVGVVLIGFATYYVALQIPATEILIKRLEQSQTTSGMLNGREGIYNFEIKKFKENMFLGIGIRGLLSLGAGDGHNIYLQLLCETGIICALFIFFQLLYNYIKSFKIYYKNVEYRKLFMYSIFVQTFFLVNGITENPFFIESVLIYYLLLTAFNNFREVINYEKKRI